MRIIKLSLVAAATLSLMACASNDYQQYAKTQESIAMARAEAEIARYKALEAIANSGDTTARVAAVIALQQGAPQTTPTKVDQPSSAGDTALRWTSVLLPSLTQFYSIGKSTDLAIVNSNNNKEVAIHSNDTMLGFGKLIVDPIVGTQDSVLVYPQ